MNAERVREKLLVKAPDGKSWKKVEALFDSGSAREYVNPKLVEELEINPTDELEKTATLHVKVLGDEYSWRFRMAELAWKDLKVDAILGTEFMRINGLIFKQTPRGTKLQYLPGYPQSPVI